MEPLARTPTPPYYAVVFTSVRSDADPSGYEETASRMVELAARQPGYLGVESVRDSAGVGITVSYWTNLEAIRAWKAEAEHRLAQAPPRWYDCYHLRVCRVEEEYGSSARLGRSSGVSRNDRWCMILRP
jgi:heme-degrading monooxygenase HmoA